MTSKKAPPRSRPPLPEKAPRTLKSSNHLAEPVARTGEGHPGEASAAAAARPHAEKRSADGAERTHAAPAERAEPSARPRDAAPAAGTLLKPFTISDVGYATDVGATAHYADPRYYSETYSNRRHDVDYYVHKARLSKGPVLEYGVGNGRIALHVARAGVQLTGVDLSRAMLSDFERRLALEPRQVRERVILQQGDMREIKLGQRFPLVIAPFNAILHLYDRRDMEAFFARVREHLADDGQFLFDFSVPQPEDLIRDPERSFASTPLTDSQTGEPVSYAERFEYDPLRQLLLVRMELTHQNSGRVSTIPLTHRQFFPREMEALLHYNGFREILFTADFTDQPADRHVDSLVVACRSTRP